MVKFNFNLKPEEALKYLRNKGYKLTFDYFELEKEAHDKAFTVAKVTRLDLLHDIFTSLTNAMEAGTGYKQFIKELEPTLQKKGWWGKKDIVNPKTGEVKEVNIDAHRLKRIYKTNMRVAYAKSRYKEQMKLPNSTYLQYISALLENSRDTHKEAHNTILPRDDVWWDTNYPPNDHGPCYCKTRAVSKQWMDKRGLKVSPRPKEDIASEGWTYHPGKDSTLANISKLDLSNANTLRNVNKNKAYENLSQEALLSTFYQKLGIKKGDLFIDKVNDPMIIDDNLFLDKKTKAIKINKEDRHLLLDEFIETIRDPDEIYLEYDKNGFKKNMLRYINIDGKKEAILAVFRYFKDKTQGATIFHVTRELEKRREMKLIYNKEQPK